MKRLSTLLLVVISCSAFVIGGCGKTPRKTTPMSGKTAGRNLLFITMDTTRADRIGCYGYKEATTPTIDGLAKRGTLFEAAYAQAPLTMVSHSCMMTGLYPREHGVRDNGSAALDPSLTTLATLFKNKGYQTAAFVASYVLDRRFGLSAGFDTYDDDMGKLDMEAKLAERQRTGNIVTDNALAWLDGHKSSQFFCWVHYYDPHEPYAPPPEFRSTHPKAYDGEIAYMDSQIKRLMDWLEKQKLTDNTTIVLVGDHGEAFGEHGEKGHAMFLYEMNLHVPMIFIDPSIPAGKRIDKLVEVVEVFPTLVDLFSHDLPAKVSSRNLAPFFAGQPLPDQDCYSESHLLFNSHGYAEQRSLTTHDWKYISSTRPELYDRIKDPDELHNLIDQNASVAKQMKGKLLDRFESWTPGKPKEVKQTDESRKALESLGYVSGTGTTSTEFLTKGLPDPKDMLPLIEQHQEANRLFHAGKYKEAIPMLENILEKSPHSLVIYYSLATSYLEEHRLDDAMRVFRKGIDLDKKNTALFIGMGEALMQSGQDDKAIDHFVASLGIDDTNPVVYYKLGQAYSKMHKLEKAIENYRKAVQLRPDFSEAQADLALLISERGGKDEAMKLYRDAVKSRPNDPVAHFNLGVALLRAKQLSESAAELQKAVSLKADYGEALVNLGICLGLQGQPQQAKDAFQKAIGITSSAAEAHQNLGVTLEKEGDLKEAAVHYEKAFELNPFNMAAAETLVHFYIRNHQMADAARILGKGMEAAPDNLKFVNMFCEILSTAQDAKVRNGAMALNLMKQACEKTGNQAAALLGTLAAAYAETGDFDKAVETAHKAIDLAKKANQAKIVDFFTPQLQQFEKKQPYRNPKY